MTAQTPDLLIYQDEQYAIAGVNGTGLITDEEMGGYSPIMASDCWHGYYCTYAIEDNRLFLVELAVGSDETQAVDGIVPVEDDDHNPHIAFYRGLHKPILLTGGIVAGRDFIQSMYVHRGFHPPYKFETLFEFLFREGEVTVVHDLSARMAELRQQMEDDRLAWLITHGDEIEEVERLKREIDALRQKIPLPPEWFPNDPANAGIPPEDIERVRAEVKAQIVPLKALHETRQAELAEKEAREHQRVRKYISDTFSLNYIEPVMRRHKAYLDRLMGYRTRR
jgi:hypothetical protein